MQIIGITGTIGAGKGALVEYLKTKGFEHYSARDFFTKELKKRGVIVNRDTMTELANELRAQNGTGYIMKELYVEAKACGKNAVIESIRTPGEVEILKSKGDFLLLAIDADPKIRYQRVVERASALDNVTYEKFLSDEAREMQNNNPSKQNIAEVMEEANFILTNNTSLEELHSEIDKILENI